MMTFDSRKKDKEEILLKDKACLEQAEVWKAVPKCLAEKKIKNLPQIVREGLDAPNLYLS